jgi:hypothetical protein
MIMTEIERSGGSNNLPRAQRWWQVDNSFTAPQKFRRQRMASRHTLNLPNLTIDPSARDG